MDRGGDEHASHEIFLLGPCTALYLYPGFGCDRYDCSIECTDIYMCMYVCGWVSVWVWVLVGVGV